MRGGELLERERELALLGALVREVSDGEDGRVAVVSGEAGVGKTALMQAVRQRAKARGVTVLEATASEFEAALPHALSRRLLQRPIHDLGNEELDRVFSGAARPAREMLKGDRPGAEPDVTTDELVLDHALYWTLVGLAERGPLLLMADDLQWADHASLRFLNHLSRRLEGLRVVVLAAARHPAADTDRSRLLRALGAATAHRLELAPLSASGVAALIAPIMDREPDARFAEACHAATNGNPFLAGELAREAVRHGLSPDAGNVPAITAVRPASVREFTAERVERLSADARALCDALAVLGSGATWATARELAGLDEGECARATEVLTAQALLDEHDPLRFRHQLLESVVYSAIPPPARESTHRRAAAILTRSGASVVVVARHLERTEPRGDPAAVAVLLEAAEKARQGGDPDSAQRFARRALQEAPSGDLGQRALAELAAAERDAGDPAAGATFRRAADGAPPQERLRCLLEAWRLLATHGRMAEARQALFDALSMREDLPRDERLRVLAAAHYAARMFLATQPVAREVRAAIGPPPRGDTTGERILLAEMAHAGMHANQPAAQVADLARRAWSDGALAEERLDVAVQCSMIDALTFSGQNALAREACETTLARARERVHAGEYAHLLTSRHLLALQEGEIRSAEDDIRQHLALMADDPAAGVPFAPAALAGPLLAQGRTAELGELLDLWRVGEHEPAMRWEVWNIVARGEHRLATGDLEGGVADLLAGGGLLIELGIVTPAQRPWRSRAGLTLWRLGRRDEARELIHEELALAQDFAAPRPHGVARHAHALTLTGGERLEGLRAAARLHEEASARLELARVLTDVGAVLRSAGQRTAAREPLRRALDLAHRCGGTVCEARARDELRAAGGRPRRPVLSGLEALTPSERRVLALAADGMTNREIGEALFITAKTAEKHLSSIFGKLAVSSRRELARVAHEKLLGSQA